MVDRQDEDPQRSPRRAARAALTTDRGEPQYQQPTTRLADPVGLQRPWLRQSRRPADPTQPTHHQRRARPSRDAAGLQIKITAHTARHTYATNWIKEEGSGEHSMEKLSRQLGTSVAKLRATYVHVRYDDADWAHICTFGSRA